MVTWGANQVHTFGKNTAAASPAPASAFSFGAAAPAGGTAPSTPTFGSSPAPAAPPAGGLFGSTPAPAPGGGLFGSTAAPAPSTGGFGTPAPASGFGGFGTPAPAPSGGLFGTPAPSPGGGLFGSTPAPAPGGLFGSSPAPGGLFGSTPAPAPGGLFGSTPAPTGPAIPAQAAIQTYMEETARNEAVKMQSVAEKVYNGYRGAEFCTLVYNRITPQQQQWQWMMMNTTGSTIPPMPPLPQGVKEEDWYAMCVNNPDPNAYMPAAIFGAEALQTRLAQQQDAANSLQLKVQQVQAFHESIRTRHDQFQSLLKQLVQMHAKLRKRQLDVMRRVELIRCRNLPLQPDEAKVTQTLHELNQEVTTLAQLVGKVQQQAKSVSLQQQTPDVRVVLPDKGQLFQVLKDQRDGLQTIQKVVQSDETDLRLLQNNLPQAHVPPRR